MSWNLLCNNSLPNSYVYLHTSTLYVLFKIDTPYNCTNGLLHCKGPFLSYFNLLYSILYIESKVEPELNFLMESTNLINKSDSDPRQRCLREFFLHNQLWRSLQIILTGLACVILQNTCNCQWKRAHWEESPTWCYIVYGSQWNRFYKKWNIEVSWSGWIIQCVNLKDYTTKTSWNCPYFCGLSYFKILNLKIV